MTLWSVEVIHFRIPVAPWCSSCPSFAVVVHIDDGGGGVMRSTISFPVARGRLGRNLRGVC